MSQTVSLRESPLNRVDGLRPYLRSFYQRASKNPGIHGRVFIVGGTEHEALACLALGAEDVVVANPWFAEPRYQEKNQEFINPHVRLYGSFAEDVDIKAGCIDVVLSTCVIEHILDIPSVLDKIAELLKPGGRALIHGGPIWTGAKGHHLWTVAEDGTRYFFNGSGDEQPVNAWEHLQFSPDEFHERLVERSVPPEHAKKIVEHIHFSINLNRLSPSDIEEMAIASKLFCVSFKRIYDETPDENTLQALSEEFSIADLSTWAVEFTLEKRSEDARARS